MPECNKTAPLIEDSTDTIDWLTKSYLENALRTYKNDESLKILKIDLIPATSKGENYASVLTRLTVNFICDCDTEPQNRQYIVKRSFEDDEFAKEKMLQYDIYNREMEIYEVIIPKLNNLLKEINDDEQIFAETIYVDYDHKAIIFEDLTVKSYRLVDRKIGLDMTHTKIALRKLAKMHATTAVLNERELDYLKKFDRGMFNRHTDAFSPFFVNTLDICGQIVSKWNGFEMYGEKLLKLTPYLMEYGKRVFDAKDDHLNVFAHGDFWTNNVMFSYNENDKSGGNNDDEPKDAIVIDFQYSCWGSPAIDLHYFFNTSLREELRLCHLEELLYYYYNILTDTLRSLNYKGKIPTLHQFWIQYMEKSFYALTSTCIVQPVMLNPETEDADFHALMKDDERARNFKRTLFKNETVQKNLRRLLPVFDRRGLLDVQFN